MGPINILRRRASYPNLRTERESTAGWICSREAAACWPDELEFGFAPPEPMRFADHGGLGLRQSRFAGNGGPVLGPSCLAGAGDADKQILAACGRGWRRFAQLRRAVAT